MPMSERRSPCPTCRAAVAKNTAAFPFCSERCRLADLGSWLKGRYVIAGERHVDEQAVDHDDEPER